MFNGMADLPHHLASNFMSPDRQRHGEIQAKINGYLMLLCFRQSVGDCHCVHVHLGTGA